MSALCCASAEGPNNPSAAVNGSGVTTAWSNPTNVYSSNNAYATASLESETSRELQATGFGFALTGCSSVDGIKVEIERKKQSLAGIIQDASVYLLIASADAGTNKASATTWPNTDTYFAYGSASDVWGAAPTCAQVTASTFGVGIAAKETAGVLTTAYIDHIRVTVTYTATVPASGHKVQVIITETRQASRSRAA